MLGIKINVKKKKWNSETLFYIKIIGCGFFFTVFTYLSVYFLLDSKKKNFFKRNFT